MENGYARQMLINAARLFLRVFLLTEVEEISISCKEIPTHRLTDTPNYRRTYAWPRQLIRHTKLMSPTHRFIGTLTLRFIKASTHQLTNATIHRRTWSPTLQPIFTPKNQFIDTPIHRRTYTFLHQLL